MVTTAPLRSAPLRSGLWVWLWPGDGPARWDTLDLPKIANAMQAHGLTGVVVQDYMDTLASLDRYPLVSSLRAAGLGVTCGFGSNGPSHWAELASKVNEALSRSELDGVLIDWEGSWDHAKVEANHCVDAILAVHPDAADRVVDTPWWAPLNKPDGSVTHPGAPTSEFGRICKRRFVQTYPGPELDKWRWAQSPTQYPALGTPAVNVRPAFALMGYSLNDAVNALLADTGPTALWDWLEADAVGLKALLVVRALAALGYTGPSAVRLFQAAAGLKVDGIVGPATLAALGVA